MTKIFDFKENINDKELEEVTNALKMSKLVVFPTETVYGIGANALEKNAVDKIFVAKGRPTDNPLIVHVSDKEMIDKITFDISEIERTLIDTFMPGPITIILKKKDIIPDNVTCGLDTVGIRMPENEIARKIINKSGIPIAAPSANISGKPSGTNVSDIKDELLGKVDYIVDGGNSNVGLESTVVKVEKDTVNILRPGKITPKDIEKLGFKVKLDLHTFSNVNNEERVASPGMKHRHYAPNAKSVLVYSNNELDMIQKIKDIVKEKSPNYKNIFVIGFKEHKQFFDDINYISFGSKENLDEVSKNIFSTLRLLDKENCDFCIIEGVKKEGMGIAILNRLYRACEYNVIEV